MLAAFSRVNVITDSDCTLSAVRHLTAMLAVDSFSGFTRVTMSLAKTLKCS